MGVAVSYQIVFFFVVPILFGGLLGWFTNWVAIKMLFWPVRPVKFLFNLQGVIPRNKSNLAEKISEEIVGKLLTPDSIREKLSGDEFRTSIAELTGKYFADVRRLRIREFHTFLPGMDGVRWNENIGGVKSWLKDWVRNYLDDEGFESGVRGVIADNVGALSEKKVSELIREENIASLKGYLSERIDFFLGQDRVAAFIRKVIDARVAALSESDRKLKNIVSSVDLNEMLYALYEREMPGLIENLNRLLEDTEIVGMAKSRLIAAIEQYLKEKKIWGTVIRVFFYNENKVNEILEENINRGIEELKRTLKREETVSKLKDFVFEHIDRFLDKRISEAMSYVPREQVDSFAVGFAERASALISDEETRGYLKGELDDFIDGLADEKLKDVAANYFGSSSEALADFASDQIIGVARGENSRSVIDRAIDIQVDAVADMTLGEILPADTEKSLLNYLAGEGMNAIVEQVPRALELIDVKEITKRSIENFPAEDINNMLHNVMKSELRFIIVLGLVLGLLIGLSQGLLLFFTQGL
ncbi:MAG TPA: DUF445 family protein [bacterium]|nr:DUF445 family protein [bacterium]